MKTYSGRITKLKSNQVFVFGSNMDGFHGAGAAGFASFGELRNAWRKHKYDEKPNGWKGRWNEKGRSEGFQEGTEGKSYAIPTIRAPGFKRSIPLEIIRKAVVRFYIFALSHPELEFMVAYSVGGSNMNGYADDEMASVFEQRAGIPENVVFEKGFARLVSAS